MTLPDSRPLSRGAKALGLFLGALFFVLVLVILLLISPPARIETTEGPATILFTADRSSVFLPGDCLTVRWEVGGIQAVHITGQPTVGSGEREACVTPESLPALWVRFLDGSEREYVLPIGIIVRSPIFWFSVVMAMLLVLAAGYVLVAPRLGHWFRPWRPYAQRTMRILEIGLLLILIVGIVSDLGLRFYFTHFGSQRERIRYIYTADDIERGEASLMPMPYVSYVASPDYPGHNRLGYRGPEIELPKPPGVFRIVALGGSTTYSTATSWEQAYPAQLEQILRDDYGLSNVEVVNAGLSGYTSWDTLANYIFRVTELEPDLLIFYEGINDVQPRAVVSECYRGVNPLRGLGPTRFLWSRPQVESVSVLYRVIGIQLGWMPDPSTLEGAFNEIPFRCPGTFVDNERIKDNPPVYFERNLRDIIVLAQANNTQVMFSTWTFNPNGDVGAIPPAYQVAVAEHNDIIRHLAAEYQLPLYDLAATSFWENPDYWADPDPIHMAAPGAHEQARRYAVFLVEQGVIPDPSG